MTPILAVAAGLLSAAIPAVGMAHIGTPPDTVTFCAGSDNLPMSRRGVPEGFEVELARALATELGTEVAFRWLPPDSLDVFEEILLDGGCDAAFGALVGRAPLAGERSIPGAGVTRPYYETGYVLVRSRDAPDVEGPEEVSGGRVAVEGESVANYLLKMRGVPVTVLQDRGRALERVAEGETVRYAYLWGPLAGWTLRERTDVTVGSLDRAPYRWRFGIAVREEDPLHERLDAALQRALDDGTVSRILQRYRVPTAVY